MNKKSITQKIEDKNKALNKALEKAKEDTKLFFNAEVNESLAKGVQMDIIKSNIGSKAGRDTLKEIAEIKLNHQGKDSADSFVRHIGKLVREGKIKQPTEKGKDISLKNNKKGIGWSETRKTATKDNTKANNKTKAVDVKKVKADIEKLLATLDLADRVVMVDQLKAKVDAERSEKTILKADTRTDTIKKVVNAKK